MKQFTVIRHGSNGANQSGTQRKVVGTILAESLKKAKEVVYAQVTSFEGVEYWNGNTVYNNQQLEVVRRSTAWSK